MANINQMDDLLYSELLVTPGFEVNYAVGLTYSLDLEALLSVPLAFGMLGELDENTRRSPLYLLEAVRKSADKLLVFCNKGQIKKPADAKTVYSLLEHSICEVCQKSQPLSNFHPKLWLIKETNREHKDKALIKFIVLSRNLTFDNSLDIAVAMTGKILPDKVDYTKQQPLIEMLEELHPFASSEKRKMLRQLQSDLMHVERFDTDGDFEDYDFIPFSAQGTTLNSEIDIERAIQGQQMIIFSPFIDKTTLNWLNARVKNQKERVLFTRKEWVTPEIFADYSNNGGEIYVMKDAMTDNSVADIDLHAKMYYVSTPKDAAKDFLFVGSANATHTAFCPTDEDIKTHCNTEFLLRLTYKRTRNRTTDFKEKFVNDSKDCKFDLLTIPPTKDYKSPAKYTEAERVLKNALANGGFEATVSQERPNTYNVALHRKVKSDKNCKFSVALLQMPSMTKEFTETALFEHIPTSKLSEFYILTVEDGKNKECVVVKIPTKGIPADRDAQIFKSYINTEEKFLRYISLMLTDNPNETLLDLLESMDNENTSNNGRNVAPVKFSPQFYEQMLKIAATAPERLEDVDYIIKRLDGENVPKSFSQMYEKFKSVISKLKKL